MALLSSVKNCKSTLTHLQVRQNEYDMGYIIVSIVNLYQFNPCTLTEAMIDMLDVLFSVDSLEKP